MNLGVSKNRGTSKSSIFIGVSIINHPFWGTPIFGNTHFMNKVPRHLRQLNGGAEGISWSIFLDEKTVHYDYDPYAPNVWYTYLHLAYIYGKMWVNIRYMEHMGDYEKMFFLLKYYLPWEQKTNNIYIYICMYIYITLSMNQSI